MSKTTTLFSALLIILNFAHTADSSELFDLPNAAEVRSKQQKQTDTYVRCWYRTSYSHNDPATDWEWAENPDGSYFTINGYWWNKHALKNMFYTDTAQSVIKERCQQTLELANQNADITFFAADNNLSYNHSIWTNDPVKQ